MQYTHLWCLHYVFRCGRPGAGAQVCVGARCASVVLEVVGCEEMRQDRSNNGRGFGNVHIPSKITTHDHFRF